MKARLGVIPIALLGVGCGHLRPWTPSVSVAFWAEDVPEARNVVLPSSVELASRWQVAPQSPWARFHKGTLFSAVDPMSSQALLPDVRQLDVVAQADAAAAQVARAGLPIGTLWMLDLRGAASAAFASRLSRDAREPVAPVVTFNNWPSTEGIVPADETLAGLLEFSPRLPPPDAVALETAHPVFLLDSWRLAYRFDEPGEGVYDNRYMLMPSDLPDVETLRARGITRVVYVVEDLDDAEVEEDDLNATFRAWQSAGIGIFLVDLDFLATAPPSGSSGCPRDWAGRLAPRGVWVRDRYTLVDDPRFYARARGGFGLAYGRPFIYPGYRHHHLFVHGGGGGGGGGRSSGGSGG